MFDQDIEITFPDAPDDGDQIQILLQYPKYRLILLSNAYSFLETDDVESDLTYEGYYNYRFDAESAYWTQFPAVLDWNKTVATFSPKQAIPIYTDFITANYLSGQSILVCDGLSFNTTVSSGSLDSSTVGVDSTTKMTGTLRMSTSAPLGTYAGINTNNSFFGNRIPLTFETAVLFDVLSGAIGNTQQYVFDWGLLDNIAGLTQTNAVHFLYDRLVSANWLCKTTASGLTTTVDSGIPVVINALTKLKVEYIYGFATFSINGVVVASISTNLPGSGAYLALCARIQKSLGTVTTFFAYLDYMSMLINYGPFLSR
jgi:hypothetical protein